MEIALGLVAYIILCAVVAKTVWNENVMYRIAFVICLIFSPLVGFFLIDASSPGSIKKQIRKSKNKRVRSLRRIAQKKRKKGELNDAIENLEEALSIDREERQTHYELASIYSVLKNSDKAFDHLEKALEYNSISPLSDKLHEVIYNSTDFEWLKTIPIPSDYNILPLPTPAQDLIFYKMMLLFDEKEIDDRQKLDESLAKYQDRIKWKKNKQISKPKNKRVARLLIIAQKKCKKGELKNAIEVLEEALDNDPIERQTHYDLASIYSVLRHSDKAFEHLEKALEYNSIYGCYDKLCEVIDNSPDFQCLKKSSIPAGYVKLPGPSPAQCRGFMKEEITVVN